MKIMQVILGHYFFSSESIPGSSDILSTLVQSMYRHFVDLFYNSSHSYDIINIDNLYS